MKIWLAKWLSSVDFPFLSLIFCFIFIAHPFPTRATKAFEGSGADEITKSFPETKEQALTIYMSVSEGLFFLSLFFV